MSWRLALIAAVAIATASYRSGEVQVDVSWAEPQQAPSTTELHVEQATEMPSSFYLTLPVRSTTVEYVEMECDGRVLDWRHGEWELENNDAEQQTTLFTNVMCNEVRAWVLVDSPTLPYSVEIWHPDSFREDGGPSTGPLSFWVGGEPHHIYLPLVKN